jgi:ribosomal protein S18 acetylase RimI-like enzyme
MRSAGAALSHQGMTIELEQPEVGGFAEHRGHGYGRAVTVAAAAALQELGSSSAIVCTPTANLAGVATYRSAGFRPLAERRDLRRDLIAS